MCFALFKKKAVKMFHTFLTDCPQNVKEMNNEVPQWHKTYVVEHSHTSPVKKDVALKRTWDLETKNCAMSNGQKTSKKKS